MSVSTVPELQQYEVELLGVLRERAIFHAEELNKIMVQMYPLTVKLAMPLDSTLVIQFKVDGKPSMTRIIGGTVKPRN